MGTYWMAANHTKRQYVFPHNYDCGAKSHEQLHPKGLGAVLFTLLSRYDGPWRGDHVEVIPDTYEDEFCKIEDEYDDYSEEALRLIDQGFYF